MSKCQPHPVAGRDQTKKLGEAQKCPLPGCTYSAISRTLREEELEFQVSQLGLHSENLPQN